MASFSPTNATHGRVQRHVGDNDATNSINKRGTFRMGVAGVGNAALRAYSDLPPFTCFPATKFSSTPSQARPSVRRPPQGVDLATFLV